MDSLEHARKQELANYKELEKQLQDKALATDRNPLAASLHQKIEDQSQWLIDNMRGLPILTDEEPNLSRLIKDPKWLNTKSFMTASIAQTKGNMNNFHARWSGEKGKETGVPALLKRYKLPYRQISVHHPLKNDGSKYYFLVFEPTLELPETAVNVDDLIDSSS